MRGRQGFALLTVLWLIAALSAAVGLGLATTRLGQRTSFNRIVLSRARWAAEACLQIAAARWGRHELRDTATVDLGRGTRCSWQMVDPGVRINVNTAPRDVLEQLWDSATARQVMAQRPIASVEQVGYPDLLAVDGPGTVNLSSASLPVILALPGMTRESAERLLARRELGRPVTNLDELVGLLSPSARAALLEQYATLAPLVTFAPANLLIAAEGWVEGHGPRAVIEVLCVPLPDRLAIVRRRMW